MFNTLSYSENHSELNYSDLQKSVDDLVGKFGLKKAVQIIQRFSMNAKIETGESQKLRLITAFVITECVSVFDLDEEQFFKATIREYREARMACYHVLKKYTDSSYSKIGARFGQTKRTILYFCHKCNGILSLPQYYKSFADRYGSLDRSTIDFISKLK